MSERFFLLLTDKEIILRKGSSLKNYPLSEGIEHIQIKLKNALSLTPKAPLCLLIDRNHQDIREEQLPPLFLWDRFRLLSHKKEAWASQGKFYGYTFFKQEGSSFLQWLAIAQNDPLTHWILWIKSLPNPLDSIFLMPLEAGNLLKKHFYSSHNYHILIYKINLCNTRYVIFKGKRLLLSRPWSGEENLRTSLHFLSRIYPDIHEKLEILNLNKDISIIFPHVTTLTNPHVLMDFLMRQKRNSLSFNIRPLSQNLWMKRSIRFSSLLFIFFTGLLVYEGLNYERNTKYILSEINILRDLVQNRKEFLKNKDITLLRSAVAHYTYIQSQQIKDPFHAFETLSQALRKHHLRLESLTWIHEQKTEIDISFFMRTHKKTTLSAEFNAFLFSLHQSFPHSHIQIIEAPFNSGEHETYKYTSKLSFPLARIRMVLR